MKCHENKGWILCRTSEVVVALEWGKKQQKPRRPSLLGLQQAQPVVSCNPPLRTARRRRSSQTAAGQVLLCSTFTLPFCTSGCCPMQRRSRSKRASGAAKGLRDLHLGRSARFAGSAQYMHAKAGPDPRLQRRRAQAQRQGILIACKKLFQPAKSTKHATLSLQSPRARFALGVTSPTPLHDTIEDPPRTPNLPARERASALTICWTPAGGGGVDPVESRGWAVYSIAPTKRGGTFYIKSSRKSGEGGKRQREATELPTPPPPPPGFETYMQESSDFTCADLESKEHFFFLQKQAAAAAADSPSCLVSKGTLLHWLQEAAAFAPLHGNLRLQAKAAASNSRRAPARTNARADRCFPGPGAWPARLGPAQGAALGARSARPSSCWTGLVGRFFF